MQQWTAWLLDRYSAAYASNQFRALQQFFKWLAGEEEIADPMAGMRPPHVPDKAVPVFADATTAEWTLGTGLGKELDVPDEQGRPIRLRVVGLLQDSIFQSELLLSQANFQARFPRREHCPVWQS